MPRTQFEELKVYQLAESLCDAVWSVAKSWSAFERNIVGSQLVRAADAIGANIAEGSGRGSYQDNRRFIRIARGSLYETQHWLRRAFKRGLLQPDDVTRLKLLSEEIGPRLNAYLTSVGPRKTPSATEAGATEAAQGASQRTKDK